MENFYGFHFRVIVYSDWLQTAVGNLVPSCYLTHRWGEKSWIYTFPKGICALVNGMNLNTSNFLLFSDAIHHSTPTFFHAGPDFDWGEKWLCGSRILFWWLHYSCHQLPICNAFGLITAWRFKKNQYGVSVQFFIVFCPFSNKVFTFAYKTLKKTDLVGVFN